MEESDSGQQPKRCPCGFWGSPQTSGLCSKCYKATVQEKTQDGLDPKAELMRSTERQSAYSSHEPSLGASSSSYLTSSRTQHSVATMEKAEELLRQAVKNSQQVSADLNNKTNVNATSDLASNASGSTSLASSASVASMCESNTSGAKSSETNANGANFCETNAETGSSLIGSNDTSEDSKSSVSSSTSQSSTASVTANIEQCDISCDNKQTSENELKKDIEPAIDNIDALLASPEKRGVKRDSGVLSDNTPESTPEKVGTKSKRRCAVCKCKLELAQRTIGRCRCDNVYCSLHRLPELHDCDFDHKEDGRREAREKMVKPTRHLGTSFKRLDSDS